MTPLTADDHPHTAPAPRPTAGPAYWLVTVLLLPVVDFYFALSVGQTLDDGGSSLVGAVATVAIVLSTTALLIAQLPSLRSMSPARRGVHAITSAVLAAAITFAAVVGVLLWAFSGCTNGC